MTGAVAVGTLLDAVGEPLRQGITQRALLELVVLGALCGPLGVWVVLYRQSYAAESLAHSMLPGLVIAALIGAPLGLGAAAGLALAAALISLAARQRLVGSDIAIAVTVTGLFGLGALIARAPEVPLRLGELLFGDPLSVTSGDLVATALLVAFGLACLGLAHRSLTVAGFDPASASALGVRVARVGIALPALIALTTLVAVQALGNLLLVAIIVGPAAAALRLHDRLRPAMLTATALAIAAGIAGIYLSYYAGLAAGASIALAAAAPFAATLPLRR